jgi:hypothetical protein
MTLTALRRGAVVALVLSATVASGAHAQEVASSIEQLRVLVRPGSDVRVTDTAGEEIKGTVQGFDGSSLRLRVNGVQQVLEESQIRTVRQRRDDSLRNGARNGFIAGAVFGALTALSVAGEADAGWNAVFIPVAVAAYGGIGTGIGVGIDAMIRNDEVIFDSEWKRANAAAVTPIVERGRTGVRIRVASW